MKNRTPRRRKKTAAARLRPFWILFFFAFALIAGAVVTLALWPGFSPKEVDVSGTRHVSRVDVLERAEIAGNVNIWLQNAHAIETRVEAIPYVQTASVRRIPPSTIAIDVTERKPFAIVVAGSRAALVDRDLRVLEPAPATGDFVVLSLPPSTALVPGSFLKTPEAAELMTTFDALFAAHVVPARLEFDKFGGAVAVLHDGMRVLLGEPTDMPKKIALIEPILQQVVEKGRPAVAIDLRAPNTPVVEYKN